MGSCGRTRTSEVNFQRKIPPQCSEKKRAPNESETLSPEDSRVLKSTQLLNPTKTTTKTHSKWRQATTQLPLSPSNELLTPTLSCSLRASCTPKPKTTRPEAGIFYNSHNVWPHISEDYEAPDPLRFYNSLKLWAHSQFLKCSKHVRPFGAAHPLPGMGRETLG